MEVPTQNKTFKPHTDLMLFAADFAKNYKVISQGRYCSKEKKFEIDYHHNVQNKFCRVNLRTLVIEMNIDVMLRPEITPNYIFFIIIWAAVYIYYINEKIHKKLDEIDDEALRFYFTTGRHEDNVLTGYQLLCNVIAPTADNNLRLRKIFDTISWYKSLRPREPFSFDIDHQEKTLTLYPQHLYQKAYKRFLNGELKAADIKITDILTYVRKTIIKKYLDRDFKIYFGFKKDVYLLQ